MTYTLIDDVPIPPKLEKLKINSSSRFPIAEMKVGQHFIVRKSEYSGATSYAHKHSQRHPGKKFESRKLGENEYGIWRTA